MDLMGVNAIGRTVATIRPPIAFHMCCFTSNSSKVKSYECINHDDGKDKIAKKMIKF
jgi:hypothetical protein